MRSRWIAWTCRLAMLSVAAMACMAQRYSFSTVAGGMDNLNINCITQDHTGYLWVGTESGLYRYDGNQFKKFGPGDGLRGRTIQSLFVTPDGTLLTGTTDGIYFQRWDGRFVEIHPPSPARPFSQRIGTVFATFGPGQVVAADRSGAFLLQRQEPELWTAQAMHLEGGNIWSVLTTPDGALWYGCGTDLCRQTNGKTTHLGAALHLPADTWLHLMPTPDGHIWVRGATHVGEIVPAEKRYLAHDLPGPSNETPYQALAVDAKGRVAAPQQSNLGLWENGHWRIVNEHNGLTRRNISALFVDREGSIWLGIVGHGLMRWVGQDRWEAFTAADGLSNDIVWASLRDMHGRLWIGTESGLNWIAPDSTTVREWREEGVTTVRAISLTESADGGLWVGSAAGALARIDERTLAGREWKVPEVYRILYDHTRHCVWVATAGGLYRVDTTEAGNGPRLVEDRSFAHPKMRFTDLDLDRAGELWAASDDGLYRLDGKGWRHIDPGLFAVTPHLIAAGHDGSVWATGDFPGLMRLRIAGNRIEEAQHIGRQKLRSEQVVALAVDRRGWLWAGHDAGVSVYDGSTWRSLTQNDGLIWNDIDTNGLIEDSDGSMWIGTSGGLSHMMEPKTIPPTVLQDPVVSEVNFGALAIINGSHIPWSASPLTISVASLSFRDAYHIHIRYRLLGLEPEWVETDQENIRYARLTPGRYRFEVQTIDLSNGHMSQVTEIDFRITPRWWQSWELQAGVALLALIGIILLWRWRVHRLLRLKRQLEQAVQHRTEDLEREKAELLRTREQMRHYAEHDGLTGLWNHRIIIDRLRTEVDRSLREHTPLSVILADLDHFKEINDTYGHPAGDRLLKEIGAIFFDSVRSYDWVGRYGGEEFLLILPGTNFANARARAEQLRQALEAATIEENGAAIRVTASFGVASGQPANYETLIREADAALYRAKDRGRNCVEGTEI